MQTRDVLERRGMDPAPLRGVLSLLLLIGWLHLREGKELRSRSVERKGGGGERGSNLRAEFGAWGVWPLCGVLFAAAADGGRKKRG